jgi:hypothetical protein
VALFTGATRLGGRWAGRSGWTVLGERVAVSMRASGTVENAKGKC